MANASEAEERAAGREIRALHVFHQPIEIDVGIIDLRADAVDDFAEVVRRNVRRHTDSDAGAAIHEKVRKGARENSRLRPRLVVVRDKIDRVLLHVGHERGAEMRHPRLGVTHRCRRIAFDGTEISLAVDERLPHRPRLRHVDEGGVNDSLAVRVIITAGVAANFGAFPMLPVRVEREIVHRKKNATLGGLQTIPRIRQRARNDDRHRVIEERPRHFFSHVDWLYLFVRVIHGEFSDRINRILQDS